MALSRYERALKIPGLPFRLRVLRSLTDAALWVPSVVVVAAVALLVASTVVRGLGGLWHIAAVGGGSVGLACLALLNFEVERLELFAYEGSEAPPDDAALERRDAEAYDARWQAADRARNRRLEEDERGLARRESTPQ